MWSLWRVQHKFVVCVDVCSIFFCWITTPNFLLFCFCQKLQVPIFIGWVSILLLLLHFCFCLGCVIIVSGPALICCAFYCLIKFFLPNSFCLFVVAMFAHNWQVVHIYRLGKFLGIVGSCLLLLGCMHDLCGTWFMFCGLVSRFADFLTKWVRTWCAEKFPGQPGPQSIPAYAPPCPAYLVLSLLYVSAPIRIHTHPYTLTCALYMLIKCNTYDLI